MRQRKPRVDLAGLENDHGKVIRTESPCYWVIKCKYCGEEHTQTAREIKNNSKSRQCELFKPHNYSGNAKRDNIIRRKYGITELEYNERLTQQNNVCSICGKTDEVDGRRLAIDHCHSTGNVRGLLCGKCNRGIGLFHDDIFLLQNAINYLKNSKVT